MTRVDPRLTTAVLSTQLLVDLWAEHIPAHYPTGHEPCPGCGHVYTVVEPLCPTAAIVKPLLFARRHEYGLEPLSRALTYNQYTDLIGRKLSTDPAGRRIDLRPPEPTRPIEPAGLFDTASLRRTGGGHR